MNAIDISEEQEVSRQFYRQPIENCLRFGDVLSGVISTNLNMRKAVILGSSNDYSMDIHVPSFSVLLTPCCTMRDKLFTLAPLMNIRRNSLFENPYFQEDMTRINRTMEPHQTVSPEQWEKFPGEEKVKRLHEGNAYAFVEFFIYQQSEVFPEYTINSKSLGTRKTRFYMIDFRHLYKLSGQEIKDAEVVLIESKVLQLTIKARAELREKISNYFGRIPQEDIIDEEN